MWPFRSKTSDTKTSETSPADLRKVSEKVLSAHSIDLLGVYSESPNKTYTVVCQDSAPGGNVGGYRETGNGRIVLIRDGKILFSRSCQRPNGGQVANNGTVVAADWLFGSELGSKLLAFDLDGTPLLEHRFMANAFSSGLSDDGSIAAIQLCNSGTEDSSKLFVFDLRTRQLLGSFLPTTGCANSYTFDLTQGTIALVYPKGRSYSFTFSGTFLDTERYETERVVDAGAAELVLIVQDRWRTPDAYQPGDLLKLLDRAQSLGLNQYPDWKALSWRLRGELLEHLEDLAGAAAAYRQALSLNPKVGVKNKLASLEKRRTSR